MTANITRFYPAVNSTGVFTKSKSLTFTAQKIMHTSSRPPHLFRHSLRAFLVLLAGASALAGENENVRHVPVSFSAESNKYAGELIIDRAGHLITEDAWILGFSMKSAPEFLASGNLVVYVDADLGMTSGREDIAVDYFIDFGKRQFCFQAGEKLEAIGGVTGVIYEDAIYVIIDKGLLDGLPLGEEFLLTFSIQQGERAQKASIKMTRDQMEGGETLSPPLEIALSPPRKYELLAESENGKVWNANLAAISPSDRPGEDLVSAPIKLIAARGEYEPLMLVLTASRPLSGVSVGKIEMAGKDEMLAEDGIQILKGKFVSFEGRDIVDPLEPMRTPVEVAAGESLPIWFNFYIPRKAKPGKYKGAINLEADGKAFSTIPVEIEVLSFSIPKRPSIPTALGFDSYGVHLQTGRSDMEILKEYLRFFADHRVGPRFIPNPEMKLVDGAVRINFERFDELAAYCFESLDMVCIQMPYGQIGTHGRFYGFLGHQDIRSPEFKQAWQDYLRQVFSHLKTRGWSDRVYFNIWDEPEGDAYEQMEAPIRWMKEVDSARRVMVIASFPQPIEDAFAEPMDSIDIWNSVYAYYDTREAETLAGKGKGVWVYNKSPTRGLAWWLWREKIVEGYLYWRSNFWRKDPWKFPAEDGSFFYYDHENGSPVTSIRWEMMREGLEDYEYLHHLETLLDKVQNQPETMAFHNAKEVLEKARELSQPKYRYQRELQAMPDSPVYSEMKGSVADAIKLLEGMLPMIGKE